MANENVWVFQSLVKNSLKFIAENSTFFFPRWIFYPLRSRVSCFFGFPPKAVDDFFFNVASFFSPRSLKVWMDCNFRSLHICLGKKIKSEFFLSQMGWNQRRWHQLFLLSSLPFPSPWKTIATKISHQDLAANKSLSNHSDDSDGSEVGPTVFSSLGRIIPGRMVQWLIGPWWSFTSPLKHRVVGPLPNGRPFHGFEMEVILTTEPSWDHPPS